MNDTKISDVTSPDAKTIKVKIVKGNSSKEEYYFNNAFTIGRTEECSIQINDGVVSRVHIEAIPENGEWWIVDKGSSNGTYFNGSKIDKIKINNSSSIELGKNGPIILFTFEDPKELPRTDAIAASGDGSVTGYIQHYFDDSKSEDEMGEHTRMMRKAFNVVQKKQSLKYKKLILVIGLIAVAAAAYSIYENIKFNKQKLLAENIFYDMKTLELDISTFKDKLANSGNTADKEAINKFDERHSKLQNNYNKLVDELGIYSTSKENKLIIQTARIFGECELNIPKDFIQEVKVYIQKWKSSKRLANAVQRAVQNNYPQLIVDDMVKQHMAPQFFYLALQESDFRFKTVGPETRYGYAKGIWQFIPPTAIKYGLAVGPLVGVKAYDPRDQRYNIIKATAASARYISDLYNTDAQASGLLVIASYNWGENNIINLIRKMPANPRDRNFWKLLGKYKNKIPKETYNYVFYIFSAAVIGEDPELFGFKFKNPLASSLQKLNQQ